MEIDVKSVGHARKHMSGLVKSDDLRSGEHPAPDGPVSEIDPYPRYKPGTYEAQCIAAEVYRDKYFKRWNCVLRFKLVPTGEPVCAFLNLGSEEKPHAGPRSEYRRAWIIANGKPPLRRQCMSAKAFPEKLYEVKIGDVTRSHDGSEHCEAAIYSIVRKILRRTYP